MDKMNYTRLKEYYAALNNEHRIKMVELCMNNGYTVTELSKRLNLDYSITSQYAGILHKAGIVKKIRNADRTVTIVSLITIKNTGEIYIADR